MRLPIFLALVSMSACAARYRTQLVGQGTPIIQPRSGVAEAASATLVDRPWAVGGGIQLPAGSYDVALAFDVPRAQLVDWTVTCPGVSLGGTSGESFEQFRERRTAELRAQRQRDRETTAAAANLVLGAVTPQVRVGDATVSGQVRVEAGVDAEPVLLPPGETGGGHLAATVHITTSGDGVCAVTAVADDTSILGSYRVTRVRDLRAEAAERERLARTVAVDARLQIKGRLLASGASVEVRAARLEAIAAQRARVDAERARVEAEAQARVAIRIDLEARARATAYEWRQTYTGYLVGTCHANPNRREEQRVERARIARAQVDGVQLRLDMALRARAQLSFYMLQQGAIARPPMPAMVAEVQGPLPFDGARWTAGKWAWTSGRWEWRAGYWSDPDVFTAAGGPDVWVGGEVPEAGGFYDDPISNPPPGYGPPSPGVRDHRTHAVREEGSRIRDHRTHDGTPAPASWTSSSRPDATVRDHRTSSPPSGGSSSSDKGDKDDKAKDQGGGRFVRDHR